MNKEEIEKKMRERFSPEAKAMREKILSDKEKLLALEAVFAEKPEELKKAAELVKKASSVIKVQTNMLMGLTAIILIQILGSFAALAYLIFFK